MDKLLATAERVALVRIKFHSVGIVADSEVDVVETWVVDVEEVEE